MYICGLAMERGGEEGCPAECQQPETTLKLNHMVQNKPISITCQLRHRYYFGVRSILYAWEDQTKLKIESVYEPLRESC